MGACNFIEFGAGRTAQQAFDSLCADAEWEYGHSPYNGTISTTRLVRGIRKVADEWSEDARDMAISIADRNGWGEKWESRAIDCGKLDDDLHMWAFYGWAGC